MPVLLRKAEVANRLRLTTRQTARMMNSGELPTVEVRKGDLRVSEDDLERWIEDRKGGYPPEDADLIQLDEAARILDVPPHILKRFAAVVPHYVSPSGALVFDRDAVQAEVRRMNRAEGRTS